MSLLESSVEGWITMFDTRRDCATPVGGRLRIHTRADGTWSVLVHPLNESFSLVLQGDESASAGKLLDELVSFLHRVPSS